MHINTILSHPGISSAVSRYCPLWALPLPARFCFWELTSNFPVGHPSWDCSSPNSLNFGVPTTPKPVSFQKWVTHPGIALAPNSLNFGVLTTSKLVSSQKASVLDGCGSKSTNKIQISEIVF
ncbi:hypothetical protein L3X38_024446 [Prunus dulcis]|uniref:Uncharacterized protein n=1 Tax=Prunus dulcis TaxID=3755 RepID=A0AAD4Z722_PRUDU|nr:hypothetical protein L3X38_024446 [Prunus dulcis]